MIRIACLLACLSVQSGSTETLRRMRRPYTAESYLGVLDSVRSSIPGVAITTDVIVGFPGESREEFEESLATVEISRFAKAHIFPFSPRPGTEAADLPGHVHPDEKKARMARMLAVADLAERDFWLGHVGRREMVLWERGGQGLTDNYLRVHCPEGEWNSFSEVEIVGVAEDGVIGVHPRASQAHP